MANVDWLSELPNTSSDTLRAWRQEIDSELKKRESKDRAEARRKIKELAEAHGINLAALASGEGTGRREKAQKYRNPNDQFQTWSGMGRKPRWVQEWLDAGKSLEELEI